MEDYKEIKKVIENEDKVLAYFGAEWCVPCKMMAPVLDKFKEEVGDVKVIKIDADISPEVMEEYGIVSIPTIIYFAKGEIKQRKMGIQSLETLKKMFN